MQMVVLRSSKAPAGSDNNIVYRVAADTEVLCSQVGAFFAVLLVLRVLDLEAVERFIDAEFLSPSPPNRSN